MKWTDVMQERFNELAELYPNNSHDSLVRRVEDEEEAKEREQRSQTWRRSSRGSRG